MPCRLMDNLEGEVVGEKVHKGGLGEDIFSADLYCEDAFLRGVCVQNKKDLSKDRSFPEQGNATRTHDLMQHCPKGKLRILRQRRSFE